MKKDKPRFYCDNCDAEVPPNTKKCPQCGRYFSFVKCPSCGFSGEEELFIYGCPSCGYSTQSGSAGAARSAKSRSRFKRGRRKKTKARALPAWLYILGGAIVTALLAFLFFR
jgi:uncharacterized membrane protein YvbJ